MKLVNIVNTFVRDEEGQDLIEYALLLALISLVCVVALTDAGKQVNNIFTSIKDKLTTAGGGGAVTRDRQGRSAPGRPLVDARRSLRTGKETP
jgi:pilus assembly protein Flp/PilA